MNGGANSSEWAVGDLAFNATSSVFTGAVVEVMRLKNNGNVGIGTVNPGYTLEVNGTFSARSQVDVTTAYQNSGNAFTITGSGDNIVRLTLNDNTTVTLPTFTAANKVFTLTIKVKQDGTGGRTLAWDAGANTIKWDQSGTAPAPNSTLNKETIYQFTKFGDESVWYASMVWREN